MRSWEKEAHELNGTVRSGTNLIALTGGGQGEKIQDGSTNSVTGTWGTKRAWMPAGTLAC